MTVGVPSRRERLLKLGVGVLFAAVAALHLAAIPRENVNWDEFALLSRAHETWATGTLVGGGRPGLGVLVLLPLVRDCSDAIAAVRAARWLWAAFTLAAVAGLWALVVAFRRRRTRLPWRGGALAAGLLVLVPVFLRWSLQVRTDQPALAATLWGGVALLASRRRPWLAGVAGLAIAVGFLFTQKALYVAALAGLLTLGDPFLDGELRWRRELARATLLAAGAALVMGLYPAVVSRFLRPPGPVGIGGGLDVFEYYRSTLGFRVYRGMVPSLSAHLLLAGLWTGAVLTAWRRREPRTRTLVVAAGVLALGAAVALFHAGAFPYFWMTLGVFPAVAFGVALEPTVDWLSDPRTQAALLALAATLLLAFSLPAAVRLLADTQRVQVESLAFIARDFGADDVGFHPEKALFCRRRDPLPTFFSQHISTRFGGEDRRRAVAEFIARFRDLPVKFLLDSYRLGQFPPEVVRFWADNYALYRARVLIPARRVVGAPGDAGILSILVAGTYRWQADEGAARGRPVIDGVALNSGDRIELTAGEHRLERADDPVAGTLWYAVDDPPSPSQQPFYSSAVLAEYRGLRTR
jgi:hypothetical protein